MNARANKRRSDTLAKDKEKAPLVQLVMCCGSYAYAPMAFARRFKLDTPIQQYDSKNIKSKFAAFPNKQIITNSNIKFSGPAFLNRPNAINVGKLDRWINELLNTKKGTIQTRCLASFTLPGSHDALTYAFQVTSKKRALGKGGTVTQKYNLIEQFRVGIRYFDIRVRERDGKLVGFHGVFDLDKYDISKEIRMLLTLSAGRKEPIVIKLEYDGNAFPLVKKITDNFSSKLLPTKDYWAKPVSECIKKGKVICLFHKYDKKHAKDFNWDEEELNKFGSYKKHKAGGYTNTHWLRKHKKKLNKLVEKPIPIKEEKLKVISLNIPCITMSWKVLLDAGFSILPSPVDLANPANAPKWVGLYRSVKKIESFPEVRKINTAFACKLNNYVSSWYAFMNEDTDKASYKKSLAKADEITGKVSGVVGMDFVNQKKELIVSLIEANNRDF